jgi:hypothetical protein
MPVRPMAINYSFWSRHPHPHHSSESSGEIKILADVPKVRRRGGIAPPAVCGFPALMVVTAARMKHALGF